MAENGLAAKKVSGKLVIPQPDGRDITLERSPGGIWVKSKASIELMRESYIYRNSNGNAHGSRDSKFGRYVPQGDERVITKVAFESNIDVMTKGPTSTGKTHMVESIGPMLGLPVITEACDERTTNAVLYGRLLPIAIEGEKGFEFQWREGSVYLGGKMGAIVYLDEFYEMRKDVAVTLHGALDDRKVLNVRETGEVIECENGFHIIGSYNPGKKYQDPTKAMKPSTALRFIHIYMPYPGAELDSIITAQKEGLKEILDSSGSFVPVDRIVGRMMDGEQKLFDQVEDNKGWVRSQEGQKFVARLNYYLAYKLVPSIKAGVQAHEKGTPGVFLDEVSPRQSNFAVRLVMNGIPAKVAIKVAFANALSDIEDDQKTIMEQAHRMFDNNKGDPLDRIDWK